MEIRAYLKDFGLSSKEIEVYLALLNGGAQPVRKIAADTGVNRGTTYDILKSLIAQGLVSYYHKKTHQYFIAEDPEKLTDAITQKERQLTALRGKLESFIPELKSLFQKTGDKPVVRFYEGVAGVRMVLADVLDACEAAKEGYCVYSSADVRPYLHAAYPRFTEERIQRGIEVKVIAIGEGGQLKGLDARRWLTKEKKVEAPTYTLIYRGKVVLVSVNDAKEPYGMIIEDAGIAATQRFIFEWIWGQLEVEDQKSKVKS